MVGVSEEGDFRPANPPPVDQFPSLAGSVEQDGETPELARMRNSRADRKGEDNGASRAARHTEEGAPRRQGARKGPTPSRDRSNGRCRDLCR
eukprot:5929288-Alexandrium_andersonii.AAC.1